MTHFLASPSVALLLLAVLAAECLALLFVWQRFRRGLPYGQTLAFLGAGAAFAVALYSVMAAKGPLWLGASLTLAFLFHLADLFARWR